MATFITKTIDGMVTSKVPDLYEKIKEEAAKHRRSKITVENWSEGKELSEGQRKFWKGILLPALSKDNGDSVLTWENKLKKEVMPEDFTTITEVIDGETFKYLPSITTLGMTKMNFLIVESVAYLRDECHLDWVLLPDELKKK